MTSSETKSKFQRISLSTPDDPSPKSLEVYRSDRSAYLFLTRRDRAIVAESRMLNTGLNADFGINGDTVGIGFLIGTKGVYIPKLPIAPEIEARVVDKFKSIGIHVIRGKKISHSK